MIVFIPLFAFLLYRVIKTKSKAVGALLVFEALCFLNYLGIIDELIFPLPYVTYGVGILSLVACIVFSRREYVKAKREYLKSRRMQRELENTDANPDDNHDKIVIERAGEDKNKIFYVKRSSKRREIEDNKGNVPHGTKESEADTEIGTAETQIDESPDDNDSEKEESGLENV